MFMEIETQSDVPIYLQLAQQIIEGIARGELRPGDSLPSVRGFAADLGMNMHTVNKAYHLLEAQHFIQIVPKTGVFIHEKARRTPTIEEKRNLQKRLKPLVAEMICFEMTEDEITEMVKEIKREIEERVE